MKDLSLHLLDIAQNSIRANAGRISAKLSVADGKEEKKRLLMEIADDGCGMSKELLKEALSPFTTTRSTRKIGLGLPLLEQSALMSGGSVTVESEPSKGTRVSADFLVSSMDRVPLGDISGACALLVRHRPEIHWHFEFAAGEAESMLDTEEIKAVLKDVPIDDNHVLEWIQNTLSEGIESIFGGVLNEVSGRIEGYSRKGTEGYGPS